MITYEEFKNKWLGKSIDWDGYYGAQCFDVYRQYCKELGLGQSPKVTGAKDIWDTYIKDDFDRVSNTPDGVPPKGSVLIWGTGVGQYGHVAICDRATKTSFVSIDQNWPVDNGKGVLHEVTHNYNSLLGWLIPKQKTITDTMTEEQKRILDFIGNKTEGDVRQAFGALNDIPTKDKQIQTLQSRVLDLEKSQKDLGDRLIALESNIQADLGLIEDWQHRVEIANKQNSQTLEQLDAMTSEKNKYKGYYETALKDQVNKYTGWQLVRMGINLLIKKSK